ncbi:hypothetical protein NKH18_32860 [Streptomyces sp. M10(2022)]
MVDAALRAHGLGGAYLWPAVLVAAELVAVTATLTPVATSTSPAPPERRPTPPRLGPAPQHALPATAARCEHRRRRALWLLAAVVDDWGGDWGISDAQPPHQGTKSWATLPR